MTPSVHEQALQAVREDLGRVRQEIARLSVEADQLHAVEQYHAMKIAASPKRRGVGPVAFAKEVVDSTTSLATTTTPEVPADASRDEAAVLALTEANRPLRAGEIAEWIIRHGFAEHDYNKVRNALFMSMQRKPQIFRLIESGGREKYWALAQWPKEKDGEIDPFDDI